MAKAQPSGLELQILGVLWEHGPSSVRDLQERLPDGKARAYTTVLSCLQVMERKGLVAHRRAGQAYEYRPMVQKGKVVGSVVKRLLRDVFGGRPSAALQYFMSEADCDATEIDALRSLIDDVEAKSPPQRRKRGAS